MIKHSNLELLETNFSEEKEYISPESAWLLLQKLEDYCQNLQAANESNWSRFWNCKIIGLLSVIKKALKHAKIIVACFPFSW